MWSKLKPGASMVSLDECYVGISMNGGGQRTMPPVLEFWNEFSIAKAEGTPTLFQDAAWSANPAKPTDRP